MSTGQHSSSGLEASQHAKGATRQNVEAIAGSDPNGVRPGKPKGEPLTTHGVSYSVFPYLKKRVKEQGKDTTTMIRFYCVEALAQPFLNRNS